MARINKRNEFAISESEPSSEKMFYQIREISELEGIKPHVLRYWETEFPQLRPEKGSTGQRIYRKKDLQLIRKIKNLLYLEKYTIAGAKRRLGSELKPEKLQMDLKLGLRENQLLNTIHKVKTEIINLLEALNRG